MLPNRDHPGTFQPSIAILHPSRALVHLGLDGPDAGHLLARYCFAATRSGRAVSALPASEIGMGAFSLQVASYGALHFRLEAYEVDKI
jgi:hypothetical protein